MFGLQLLPNFVVILAAALAGGVAARLLRLPTILGFLVAGVLIGPYTPGPVQDLATVRTIAEFGLAFLLFGLGAQISIDDLRHTHGLALLTAVIQIVFMVGVSLAGAALLHLPLLVTGLFTFAVSMTSSAVIVKLLESRGDEESLHGRFAIGVSIGQDLLSIPVIVLLASLNGNASNMAGDVLIGVGEAVGLTLTFYIIGVRLLPPLLDRASAWGREVFLLAVVLLALGSAAALEAMGLSLTLGAFLAGLVLGETHLNRQAVSEVLPLRDIFAPFFFVSVGMLLNLKFVLSNPLPVLAVLAVIILGKFVVTSAIALGFKFPIRSALLAGVLLAQIGEFAFIVGESGLSEGIFSQEAFSLLIAGAVVSIIVNPLLLQSGSKMFDTFLRLPYLGRLVARSKLMQPEGSYEASGHVVLCGYSDVGRQVAAELRGLGIPYVVVEMDPWLARDLTKNEAYSVVGDPVQPTVLEQAGVRRARSVAVTMADIRSAERVVGLVRKMNRKAVVVVRATVEDFAERFLRQGSNEVVRPDFEVSQEFVRRLMREYGYGSVAVAETLDERREAFEASHEASTS